MNYLLEVFEGTEILGFSLPNILIVIAAGVFVYQKIYKKGWIPWYEGQRKKDEMLQAAFDKVNKYEEIILKYEEMIQTTFDKVNTYEDKRVHDREQSFEIQDHWSHRIDGVVNTQTEMKDQLTELAKQIAELFAFNKQNERSAIRGVLIDSHRYYTSDLRNPRKEWTEMEAHAFWEQCKSYEEAGGNDYVHSDVIPDMEKLTVVLMSDQERITDLMKSRR